MTIAASPSGPIEGPVSPLLRTGLVLRDPLPWHQVSQIVQTAEETGYEAVFVPEIAAREAFSTLAAFTSCTSRVSLGTGVVTVQSRTPQTTAMAAATVHELSGGRLVLGIGAGTAARPLETVESYVRVVKALLRGETVSDSAFAIHQFTLGIPLERPPPVWLAALGDRMLRLAGRIADGVVLNWCTPERVARARALLDAASREAGRAPSDVTVAVYVRCCLGVEERVALEALRPAAGQYAAIPHYRRQMEEMGFQAESEAAAAAIDAGKPEAVPDRLVRGLTVLGGRREALERFDAYHRAGADLVLCYPVPAREPFSSILGTAMTAAPEPAVER